MARKSETAPRRRRTADEARHAILDAAEKALVAAGPAGIRLQEVAEQVGVSHPTVLHHFGSREGLIEAVVARAMESLGASLINAVRDRPADDDETAGGVAPIESMLKAVSHALVDGGHARAFLWLTLAGYPSTAEELHVRAVAEVVHEERKARRVKKGKKKAIPFEDTYFTVLLPALALMSLAVLQPPKGKDFEGCGPAEFRAWLAKLIQSHLEAD